LVLVGLFQGRIVIATIEIIQAGAKEQARGVTLFLERS
jgi:hypothetical protein